MSIVHTLCLQRVDAAMVFAVQHRVFARGDLEKQLSAIAGFDAEMHLGRTEQRHGGCVMLDAVTAEAVAGNLQAITGSSRHQRPALRTANLTGLDEAITLQAAMAVKQINMLFIGLGLPRRNPAHGDCIRAVGLQIQAAVANVAPLHWRSEGVQRHAESEQQGQALHAAFLRCSISHIGLRSPGRMNSVCQNGTPLSLQ